MNNIIKMSVASYNARRQRFYALKADILFCRQRIDNEFILHAVTRNSRPEALQGIHTSIILSTHLMDSLIAENDLSTSTEGISAAAISPCNV